MLIKPTDVETGTKEWWRTRNGILTGSRAHDIMNRSRSYLRELIHVRQTGERLYSFDGPAVQWGREQEPAAIAHYEMVNGLEVERGRLIADERLFDPEEMILYWRGTPDGFVEEHGLIEVKCPYSTSNQIVVAMSGEIPKKHWAQMQAYMGIANRPWCDYISFDPRQPVRELQYFCKRVYRDQAYYQRLISNVEVMWEIVKSGRVPEKGEVI